MTTDKDVVATTPANAINNMVASLVPGWSLHLVLLLVFKSTPDTFCFWRTFRPPLSPDI